eukprot:6495258-Prymnesium_polylepis.1
MFSRNGAPPNLTCRVVEWDQGSTTSGFYRPTRVSGVTRLSGHVAGSGTCRADGVPPRGARDDAAAVDMD